MQPTLTLAIIGHLVGDYLLQNDWMALNKKQRSWPCIVHCALWTTAVCWFAGWPFITDIHEDLITIHYVPIVLFVTHFIQDRTNIVKFWMTKINHQPKFVEPPMAPWSLIVVDNVWHIVTIWAVWKISRMSGSKQVLVDKAAIKLENGQVYSVPRPGRHNNVFKLIIRSGVQPPIVGEQGFLLTDGTFVGRIKAAEIAFKTRQCYTLEAPPHLYTEDLW